jgi:hypothetical protein
MQTRLRCHDIVPFGGTTERSFDPYVCLRVQIGSVKPAVLYWRILDPTNLLEIGVNAHSGQLALVKLVLFRRPIEVLGIVAARSDLGCVSGVPVFDTSAWQRHGDVYDNRNYYLDVEGEVGLAVSDGELLLRLFHDPVETCITVDDSISVHLNRARELCAVQLHHLRAMELGALHDYILFQNKKTG